MRKNLLKTWLTLVCLLFVTGTSWADKFNTTYSYGLSNWSLTNYIDESACYRVPSGDEPSVATFSGIFSGKTITSNVVVTIYCATYGSGTSPTASTFSLYKEAACTNVITARQGGILPTSSTYTDVTYTITQANAASLIDDLAIKITKPGKTIRLRSINVVFTYTNSNGGSDPAPTHTAHFSINGTVDNANNQTVEEGAAIPFPSDPEIDGVAFMGWTTSSIVGTRDEAPTMVNTATEVMGTNDVTYYAVFAEEDEEDFTESYGWETESDENWIISSKITRVEGTGANPANSGSYYGAFGSSCSVQFKNKVRVKAFSYYCVRKTTNTNTSIKIETSTDGATWIEALSTPWNTFNSDSKTYTRVEKTWDSPMECYVRVNIVTSADRMLDDVSITYGDATYSNYCTRVPGTSTDIAISFVGYTTYYNSATAYTMPADCEGYVFTAADGLGLAYEAGTVVPAGEPLIIHTTAPGSKTLLYTTSAEQTYKEKGENDLDGTDEQTALADDANYYFYGLTMGKGDKAGKVGFFWMNATGAAFTNGAHKAYLKLPKGGSIKGFTFEDLQTAINALESNTPKLIFDLQGRKINAARKGIFIVNGKKVVK